MGFFFSFFLPVHCRRDSAGGGGGGGGARGEDRRRTAILVEQGRRLAGLAGRLARITRPEETGKLARGRSRRLYTGSLDLIRLRPAPRSRRSYWLSGGPASQSPGSVSVSRRWLVERGSLAPPPFPETAGRSAFAYLLFIRMLISRRFFVLPRRNNVLSYFVNFANDITKRRHRLAWRESGAECFCATAGRHGDQRHKKKINTKNETQGRGGGEGRNAIISEQHN